MDFSPPEEIDIELDKPVAEKHSGCEADNCITRVILWFKDKWRNRFKLLSSTPFTGDSTDETFLRLDKNAALKYFDGLYNKVVFRFATCLPDTPWIAQTVAAISRWKCVQLLTTREPGSWRYFFGATFSVCLASFGLSLVAIPVGFVTGISLFLDTCVCKYRQLRIATYLFGSHVVASYAFKYISKNWLKITIWSSASLATLFICSSVARRILYARRNISHGNLNPKHVSEVQSRDTEDSPWQKVFHAPSTFIRTRGMSRDDFKRIIHGNLRRLVFDDVCLNRRPKCQCLMIKGNFGLIPAHAVTNFKEGSVRVSVGPENSTLGTFDSLLDTTMLYHIPNTDICIIFFSRANQCRDITSFFPTEPQKVSYGALLSKNDFNVDLAWECNVQSYSENLRTTGMVCDYFPGYTSFLHGNAQSYEGLCGAPLISFDSPMCILGLHLGAVYDKDNPYKECLSGTIFPSQIDKGIEELCKAPLVHTHASWGEVPDKLYDKEIISSTKIHPRSAISFQKASSISTAAMHLGCGVHRIKYKTKCTQTPISPYVRELFQISDKWAGPAFHKDWVFNTDYLTYAAKCPAGLPCSHVTFAYNDYLTQVMSGIDYSFFHQAKPLNDIANVNGIPQCRFIDALTMTTSVGYPINRPKTDYITDADPNIGDYTGYQHPRILDNFFFEEVNRCEKLLLKGVRPMCVFYASLKDEPTKITKDKVRIFQSAPMALSLLVRKYFLPIARIFSCNPLTTECAVGISAEGPEWYEWDSHVFKFGPKRVLAGDYSKYDLRMPAQLSTLALGIMIKCAERCQSYSPDDLLIMKGLVTELSYPLVHLNGDIVGLLGSNPSGHNLTVYVNSIVNSLIFRCAYYSSQLYSNKSKIRPFKSICAASFYGDDAIATINKCLADDFCFKQMKAYLENHGIVFTPPDKSDDKNITFFRKEDVDFLKRRTVFVPEIYLPVGALCEDSVLKSLCCILEGAESPETVTQSNLTLASRTFFYHGRTIFNKNQKLLRLLADSQGWNLELLRLHYEFDDWARIHMQTHRKEYVSLYNHESDSGKSIGSLSNLWSVRILEKYPYYFDVESVSSIDYMRENILLSHSESFVSPDVKWQRDSKITDNFMGANPHN